MTTLKRNGSDYSATILGALFNAGHITIWTDVDGVFSADPRKVPLVVDHSYTVLLLLLCLFQVETQSSEGSP